MKKAVATVALAMVVCAFAACGTTVPNPTTTAPDTPKPTAVRVDIPADSILYFKSDKGAALLKADMDAGKIPVLCVTRFDEEGYRPEIEVTDPDTIIELYKRFAQMTVGDKTPWSVTDAYHYISFTLQDGTTMGWNFESSDYLWWGNTNYDVVDKGDLWPYVYDLQEQFLSEGNNA